MQMKLKKAPRIASGLPLGGGLRDLVICGRCRDALKQSQRIKQLVVDIWKKSDTSRWCERWKSGGDVSDARLSRIIKLRDWL